ADLVESLCRSAYQRLGAGRPVAEIQAALAAADAVASRTKDAKSRAHVLLYTGVIACDRGDNVAALKAFGQALPLYQQVGDKEEEAHVYFNQGRVYLRTGDHAAALKANAQALPLYQQVGDKQGEANVYVSQGLVY